MFKMHDSSVTDTSNHHYYKTYSNKMGNHKSISYLRPTPIKFIDSIIKPNIPPQLFLFFYIKTIFRLPAYNPPKCKIIMNLIGVV